MASSGVCVEGLPSREQWLGKSSHERGDRVAMQGSRPRELPGQAGAPPFAPGCSPHPPLPWDSRRMCGPALCGCESSCHALASLDSEV